MTGQDKDFVLVPRKPTPEMLAAGWYEAHDENAEGVWRDMIAAYEGSCTDVSKGNFARVRG